MVGYSAKVYALVFIFFLPPHVIFQGPHTRMVNKATPPSTPYLTASSDMKEKVDKSGHGNSKVTREEVVHKGGKDRIAF